MARGEERSSGFPTLRLRVVAALTKIAIEDRKGVKEGDDQPNPSFTTMRVFLVLLPGFVVSLTQVTTEMRVLSEPLTPSMMSIALKVPWSTGGLHWVYIEMNRGVWEDSIDYGDFSGPVPVDCPPFDHVISSFSPVGHRHSTAREEATACPSTRCTLALRSLFPKQCANGSRVTHGWRTRAVRTRESDEL